MIAGQLYKERLATVMDNAHEIILSGSSVVEPSLYKGQVVGSNPTQTTNFDQKKSTDEQKLNKTERAFLSYLRMLGHPDIGVQDLTLKIGDDCRFTPDFRSIDQNGRFCIWETKGYMRDDALVKLKVAARKFSRFDFYLVKKNGASWDITPVKP